MRVTYQRDTKLDTVLILVPMFGSKMQSGLTNNTRWGQNKKHFKGNGHL